MKRLVGLGALMVAAGLAWAGVAGAQTWPSQKITILLPTPPGGSIDLLGRAIGRKMEESLGQPVVIENRAGAGGMIAAEAVARSTPDGYTLGLVGPSIATGPVFLKANKVDPEKDFAPIRAFVYSGFAVVVPGSLGVKTLPELIAKARAEPKKLNYGVIPVTGMQLDAMELMRIARIDITEIPYQGVAPTLTGMLSGQVEVSFMAHSTIAPHMAEGKLVPIAATGPRRIASLPQLPTLRESGIDFDMGFWYGYVGPVGMPAAVLQRLDKVIADAAKSPEIVDIMNKNGFEPLDEGAQAFGARIKRDAQLYQTVAKRAGIEPK
jgi:tripartite-type tricarboxylate transporter receptor subunit TctC